MRSWNKWLLLSLLAALLLCVLAACGASPAAQDTYTVELNGVPYTVDTEQGTITDGENTFSYTFSGTASDYRADITYPDGSTYFWVQQGNTGYGGWSDSYAGNGYVDGETLCAALKEGAPEPAAEKGRFVLYGLLLLGFGLFGAVSPRTVWTLEYGWRFKDAEPSELALTLNRVGGVVMLGIGIVLLLL